MPSILLLLVLPLALAEKLGARNIATTDCSHLELLTFFGTASLQNKIMTVSRQRCFFFQIPWWIKLTKEYRSTLSTARSKRFLSRKKQGKGKKP